MKKDPDNKLQQIEREADKHMLWMLKKLCAVVDKKLGINLAFRNYVNWLEKFYDEKNWELEAKKSYGDRYQEEIEKKIELKYNIMKKFYNKYFIRDSKSDFINYLSILVEDFVNDCLRYNRNCSLEDFEKGIFTPSFVEQFKQELVRQSVVKQFDSIIEKSHIKGSSQNQRVNELFDQYLVDKPSHISIISFGEYLLQKTKDRELLKWARLLIAGENEWKTIFGSRNDMNRSPNGFHSNGYPERGD